MTKVEFISAEDVCNIQKATLSGAPSSNIGLVEGAVTRVIHQYLYNGISDIFELAALYLIAIAKAHAFPDANKRTAFQSAMMFLDANGISICENDNLIEITVKAAEVATKIREIVDILKSSVDG